MCLFKNKGNFGNKFSITEKGVLKEFWRSAHSPTLKLNTKWNLPPYKILGTEDNNNYITIFFITWDYYSDTIYYIII